MGAISFAITHSKHPELVGLLFPRHTHALKNLHIPAIAYFINTLDSQSSERGMGGPNYFKVGDLF